MDLLEFARGPAWWAAVAILVVGSAWRIWGIFRLPMKPDYSEPRSTRLAAGAWRAIISRFVPKPEFRSRTALAVISGYTYHIGLAIVVFGYVPHIGFIERLTALAWPALPSPIVYFAVALTFVSLLYVLMIRLTDPVLRLISSFDDYFTWLVVMLPLVTGMAALDLPYSGGVAPGTPLNPTPVALHLLSVELLLTWLPFGKLAHAFTVFISRGTTGAAFERKGAHA